MKPRLRPDPLEPAGMSLWPRALILGGFGPRHGIFVGSGDRRCRISGPRLLLQATIMPRPNHLRNARFLKCAHARCKEVRHWDARLAPHSPTFAPGPTGLGEFGVVPPGKGENSCATVRYPDTNGRPRRHRQSLERSGGTNQPGLEPCSHCHAIDRLLPVRGYRTNLRPGESSRSPTPKSP